MINKIKITKAVFSVPAIVIMGGIFYLSHIPELPKVDFGLHFEDKLAHLIAYFVLGIALILALKGNFIHLSRKKIFTLVVLIGSLYGISDEFHQSFVPGRYVEFLDWVADITGIFLSLTMLGKISNFADRKFGRIKKDNIKTTIE